jgi:choline-sulfatase
MKQINWVDLLTIVAFSVTALVSVSFVSLDAGAGEADKRQRPNILFIMTDQQHAGMLSCAGNLHLKTPALDALASMGIRFELAYATNPVCVPSRFSLQTGRMPSAIGMRTNESKLSVPRQMCVESLGPLLRRAGYQCVYGGKDHMPDELSKFAMTQGYEKLTKNRREGLAKACSEFLKRPHDRPFFLFASFINPHDICYMVINDFARHQGRPIVDNKDSRICERFLDKARNSGDLEKFIRKKCPPLPDNFDIPENEPEAIDNLGERSPRRYARDGWSEDTWRLHRWLYVRLTERVDAQIGTVLGALKESGLENSTLVIFTSDHGDMDAAHRLEHKGVLYEESVGVPFIMAQKGVIPSGRVDREHLVSNGLDVLPTLCDYAGIETPGGLAGRSLRPLAEGLEVDEWRSHVFVECHNGRMVRTARFKYCVYSEGELREMLIDLNRDPGEMKNLAASPRHCDELNRHRRLLLTWLQQQHDTVGLSYAVRPEGSNR